MSSMHGLQEHADSAVLSSTLTEQIAYYSAFLTAELQRNVRAHTQEALEEYRKNALTPLRISGQNIHIFAPFNSKLSALRTITRGQAVVLALMVLIAVLAVITLHLTALIIALTLLTTLYFCDMLAHFWLAVRTLHLSVEEQIDDLVVQALATIDWPRYTILCPLYRETAVLTQFVQAMQRLDYPLEKLQILLLTEERDVETRQRLEAMNLPAHFEILTVPVGVPQTKPRACNYGLLQASGEYVVIYDAEDLPDPLQLKKAVMTFATYGTELACVQAKLNFYNTQQNLLTRWFTAEYSLWFDLMLPGLQKLGVQLPLGGTSNHFRIRTLRALGAWDAFNVTEDCDLGLRMSYYGLRTCVLDSTTYEEANSDLRNWLRQRSRWIKGYMQTYLVYMRNPALYLRSGRLGEFLALQLFIGGKVAALLFNPLMLTLLIAYILFQPVTLYHTLFPTPVLYAGMACFIFGNFFYLYAHLVGCMKRGYYAQAKWALLTPLYWLLMSAAAYIAFYQLIFKPHHWEKTHHGLHLHASSAVQEELEQVKQLTMRRASAASLATGSLTLPRRQQQEVELISTSTSSNISVSFDDVELEITEKRMRVKLRTNPQLPVVHLDTPIPAADSVPITPAPSSLAQDEPEETLENEL